MLIVAILDTVETLVEHKMSQKRMLSPQIEQIRSIILLGHYYYGNMGSTT